MTSSPKYIALKVALAVLFHAATLTRVRATAPERAFAEAEAFIAEAEKRYGKRSVDDILS